MAPPKGHAPYPGCETGGRPRRYNKDDIDKFASELLIWIKDDSHYWIKDFCLEKEIDPGYMHEWAQENDKFNHAYRIAKSYQESRIFQGSMEKTYDSGTCKFALNVNHGWVDKNQTVLSGDVGNPIAFALQSNDGNTKDLINGQNIEE